MVILETLAATAVCSPLAGRLGVHKEPRRFGLESLLQWGYMGLPDAGVRCVWLAAAESGRNLVVDNRVAYMDSVCSSRWPRTLLIG